VLAVPADQVEMLPAVGLDDFRDFLVRRHAASPSAAVVVVVAPVAGLLAAAAVVAPAVVPYFVAVHDAGPQQRPVAASSDAANVAADLHLSQLAWPRAEESLPDVLVVPGPLAFLPGLAVSSAAAAGVVETFFAAAGILKYWLAGCS
jgi:hypothetical protein